MTCGANKRFFRAQLTTTTTASSAATRPAFSWTTIGLVVITLSTTAVAIAVARLTIRVIIEQAIAIVVIILDGIGFDQPVRVQRRFIDVIIKTKVRRLFESTCRRTLMSRLRSVVVF